MAERLPQSCVLDDVVDRLHNRGRLRVWSLVVTIFGDAVMPRGGRIALSSLQELMDRLRVEPGALRTALSRLAKDHWVLRERQGRNSFFSLDARGRHAFDQATRRIYAGGSLDWDGSWTVAIAPPGGSETATDLSVCGFVRVNGGVYLRPETKDAPDTGDALDGMLVIHGSSAEHPETFRTLWPSVEIAKAYRTFIEGFSPFREALDAGRAFTPIDAMAARTLMLHDWRRIALRDPGLPAALLPANWPGEEARDLTRSIYTALVPASEAWLDTAGLPPQSDPQRFLARFVPQSSR